MVEIVGFWMVLVLSWHEMSWVFLEMQSTYPTEF